MNNGRFVYLIHNAAEKSYLFFFSSLCIDNFGRDLAGMGIWDVCS